MTGFLPRAWEGKSRMDEEERAEQLVSAVSGGNVEEVTRLLKSGVNVNTVARNGMTVLGKAAYLGHADTVRVLLNAHNLYSANFQLSPEMQLSPSPDWEWFPMESSTIEPELHHSSKNAGRLVQVSAEVNSGANVGYFVVQHQENDSDEPPTEQLAKASVQDKPQDDAGAVSYSQMYSLSTNNAVPQDDGVGSASCVIPWAWGHRCQIDLPDFFDRSPLHYAALQGHLHIVDMLIRAGCSVNTCDSDNMSALHAAVMRGHTDIVKLLLSYGVYVNTKTSDKTSALHIAASRGFSDISQILLDAGAKVNAVDSSDRTPLYQAVSRGNNEVVMQLLKRNASINVEEIHGYTPLCEAVWSKDVDLTLVLFEAGAKVTQSHNLLHYAILHRQPAMAVALIRNGSVPNLRDPNGDTPLILAARTAQLCCVNMLLGAGAKPSYGNGLTGSTALHEAVEGIRDSAYEVFLGIAKSLVEKGAGLSKESFTRGDTPLYRALLLNKLKVAQWLIEQGCDVNKGQVYSCTDDNLCLARRRNHFYLVRLMVYAGFNLKRTSNWLEILPSDQPPDLPVDTLRGWLIHVRKNPLRLTELCRICLRQTMGEEVTRIIPRLNLPQSIKRYLLLEIGV